jgi:hypothetical protein
MTPAMAVADGAAAEKTSVEVKIVPAVRADKQAEFRGSVQAEFSTEQRVFRQFSGNPAPEAGKCLKIVHRLLLFIYYTPF